jgi:tetratricopeptide (TPR) repeat protein
MRCPLASVRVVRIALVVAVFAVTSGLAAAQSVSVVVPPAGAAREAFRALEEGRYKDADSAFARALSSAPDDAALLLGAGLVARRLGDLPRAKDHLARALQIDPAFLPASQVLGSMLYETGDLEGAIRVYEAALVRAPGQEQMQARVEEWRKEADLHSGFRRAQGGHFEVLFEGPAEQDAAAAAVEILERAYVRIGDQLLAYPNRTITVVLYTQQQFRDVTRTPGWSGGLFDGRIRLPIRGGLSDPKELERVLTHEYVHALVHGIAAGGVPAWLNEGLATALEPDGLERARKDIARASEVPTPAQLSRSFGGLAPGAVLAAYASSALAVHAILERAGTPRLMGLLADLGAGEDFERAFASWVQLPFEDFEREWMSGFGARRDGR